MSGRSLIGTNKRQQIESTNKQVMVWVAIAAAAVTICLVVAVNFVQRIIYQAKVNRALGETSSTLEKNVQTEIPKLISNVNALRDSDRNLERLLRNPERYSRLQVIADALPLVTDQSDEILSAINVSLAASLQSRILVPSRVSVEQIRVDTLASGRTRVSGETETALTPDISRAQSVLFTVVVSGQYADIQNLVLDMERTIRPINIETIKVQGSDDWLQATITATTFYVFKTDYQLGKKEIEP
jgi:hypothetical protein